MLYRSFIAAIGISAVASFALASPLSIVGDEGILDTAARGLENGHVARADTLIPIEDFVNVVSDVTCPASNKMVVKFKNVTALKRAKCDFEWVNKEGGILIISHNTKDCIGDTKTVFGATSVAFNDAAATATFTGKISNWKDVSAAVTLTLAHQKC